GAAAAITGGRLALLAEAATASAVRTITVADTNVANDLTIGSAVVDGQSVSSLTLLPITGGITKTNATGATGASRLVLSGANTYSGVTTDSGGFLQAVGSAALGAASATEGLGTNIAGGAVLELNNVNLVNENLNLDF